MPILDELFSASYKNAKFFLTRSSIAGGRKTATKDLVNSDFRIIEDLGLIQPVFSLTGVVAANGGPPLVVGGPERAQSYKQMRDALLDALQSPGPGQLIHPFYGPIENVVCKTFTISEAPSSVGTATLTMSFEISNSVVGQPFALAAVLGTITNKFDAEAAALEAAMAADFEVTESFAGNFADAVQKGRDFANDISDTADKFVQDASVVDEFSRDISQLAADMTRLVTVPTELADKLRSAILSLNGLLQTPPAIFDAMKELFDFGDLDIRFSVDTAGKQERQKNRDRLNSQMQAQALAQAYVSTAELDLPTVEDIDETSGILETQFQKIIEADAIDRDSLDALFETRIASTDFFNEQRATKPRRVGVTVNTIPARVLAYTLYGESDQGPDIASLNSVRDSAFIEGEVEVLSS